MARKSGRHSVLSLTLAVLGLGGALASLALLSPWSQGARGQEAAFDIALSQGWNLVSLPLVPDDSDPAAVLASISDNLNVAWAYDAALAAGAVYAEQSHLRPFDPAQDRQAQGEREENEGLRQAQAERRENEGLRQARGEREGAAPLLRQAQVSPWLSYDPDLPAFLNSLTAIDETMGFWLNMGGPATLTVTGTEPESTDISIFPDWNFIGYPVSDERDVADVLAGIPYNSAWAYDPLLAPSPWQSNDPDLPPSLNSLQQFTPTRGYALNASQADTLTVIKADTIGELIIEPDWRDYGDAPDGSETGYTAGTAVGSFPTRPENSGPRHPWPFKGWLGELASVEPEPADKTDASDDGIQWLELVACGTSSALVMVNLGALTPEERAQPVFLNLLADWNRDGRWEGEDACAPEWALQNQPLDLSEQSPDSTLVVLAVDFPGGAQVDEFWFRATVSRQPYDPAVGGEMEGETEDYLITGGSLLPPAPATAKLLAPLLAPNGVGDEFFCRGVVVPHGGNGLQFPIPVFISFDIDQTQASKKKGFRPEDIKVQASAPNREDGSPAGFGLLSGADVGRVNLPDGRVRLQLVLTTRTTEDPPDRLEGPFIIDVRVEGGSNKGPFTTTVQCAFYVDHAGGSIGRIPGLGPPPDTDGFTGLPGRAGSRPGLNDQKFIQLVHGQKIVLNSDAANANGRYDPASLRIFGDDGRQVDLKPPPKNPKDDPQAAGAGIRKVSPAINNRRAIALETIKDPPTPRVERIIIRLSGKLADGTEFVDYYRVVIVHAAKDQEKSVRRLIDALVANAGGPRPVDEEVPTAVLYAAGGREIRSTIVTGPDELWPQETLCAVPSGFQVSGIMHGSTAFILRYAQGGSDILLIPDEAAPAGAAANGDQMDDCRDLDLNLTNLPRGEDGFDIERGSSCGDMALVGSKHSRSVPDLLFQVKDGMPPEAIPGGSFGRTPSCAPPFVYFSRDADGDGGLNIVRIPFQICGGECLQAVGPQALPLQPLTGPDIDLLEPVVSPDGTKLVFSRWVRDNGGDFVEVHIFVGDFDVATSDISNVRQLTFEGRNRSPTWSPDSEQIAFQSDRDGNQEIYVMNADGSGQRNATNTPDVDEADPSWMTP